MKAHEMIARYVHEVGRHLPSKNREDIQMELRSLLQDMVDEQTADPHTEPSTKIVAEILREMGKPEEMAAKYRPPQALIGAQIFPIYKLVITIVLTIVAAVHLFGVLYALLQGETAADLGSTVLESLISFGRMAFLNLGLITVIFAVVERVEGGELGFETKTDTDWDPYQLPPIKDPDRIDRFEMIIGIIFAALFIVAFNFFYEWIGFVDLTGDDRSVIPFLAPEFQQHVPWLTASWVLDSLLKVVVLAQGRWQRTTRWIQLIIEGFSVFVLYRILVTTPIAIVPIFTTVTKGIIILVIVIVILEMLTILFRLLFGRPFIVTNYFKSRTA
jgi:hypothetical protein